MPGDNTPTDSLLDDLGIAIEDSRSQRRKRIFQDFLTNNKRRSTRNRQGGKSKTVDLNISYRELLVRFLPTSIFAEVPVVAESEPTNQANTTSTNNNNTNNTNNQNNNGEQATGAPVRQQPRVYPEKIVDLRENEADEVRDFIERHKNSAALNVMVDYLKVLAYKDDLRWPSELKGVFMGLYERLRHNYQRPDENDEERVDEVSE